MTVSTQPAGQAAPLGPSADLTSAALGKERLRRVRLLGVALFIVAESMIFVPLFAIRFLIAGTDQPAGLNGGLAGLLTVVMVASFAAMYAARRAVGRQRWALGATALWTAAALGLLTAVGAGTGWTDPALDAASGFGGIFYLTTGAHAVHLVVGSVFLGGLAIQARRGQFAGLGRTLLDAAYWFWAFLLVVWLAIDVVFYLV